MGELLLGFVNNLIPLFEDLLEAIHLDNLDEARNILSTITWHYNGFLLEVGDNSELRVWLVALRPVMEGAASVTDFLGYEVCCDDKYVKSLIYNIIIHLGQMKEVLIQAQSQNINIQSINFPNGFLYAIVVSVSIQALTHVSNHVSHGGQLYH